MGDVLAVSTVYLKDGEDVFDLFAFVFVSSFAVDVDTFRPRAFVRITEQRYITYAAILEEPWWLQVFKVATLDEVMVTLHHTACPGCEIQFMNSTNQFPLDREGMANHDGAKPVALSYLEKRDEIMVPLEEWCIHRARLVTELRSISKFFDLKTCPAAAICSAALIGACIVAVVGYQEPELVLAGGSCGEYTSERQSCNNNAITKSGVLLLAGIVVIVVLIEVAIKKERKRHMYRALELLNLDVVFTSEFMKTIAPHTDKDSIVVGIEERLNCQKDFKSAVRMKVYQAWKALEMPLHHTAIIYVPNLPEIAELLRNYVDNAKEECEDVRRKMTENAV